MNYKFNEDKLVKELMEYVDQTYNQHYATDKYQATDVIIDSGHGTGFCLGNVIKYAKRYGRKGNAKESRKDIMKILHYALIQLHIHDEDNKTKFANNKNAPGHFNPFQGGGVGSSSYAQGLSGRFSIDDATPEEWDKANRVKGAPLCG